MEAATGHGSADSGSQHVRIATFRLVNSLFLGFAYRAHYRKTQFAGCRYWSGPKDTDLEAVVSKVTQPVMVA